MEGSLELLSLPTLVQLLAQEGHQAQIQVEAKNKKGLLYIETGQIKHAELQSSGQDPLVGEEAFYEILDWRSGQFKVTKEIASPQRTIETNWDFLLMEGLRRSDERRASTTGEADEAEPDNIFSNLSDADVAVLQGMLAQQKENTKMANIEQTLSGAMNIDGAIAAALVDWESGLTLGTAGGGNGFNIDLAAAGNTNVVKSKMGVMQDLKIKGGIEDILITLTDQIHIIRTLHDSRMFLYLALRRDGSNLGLARHQLSALEKDLSV
jgi:hypothetical protein